MSIITSGADPIVKDVVSAPQSCSSNHSSLVFIKLVPNHMASWFFLSCFEKQEMPPSLKTYTSATLSSIPVVGLPMENVEPSPSPTPTSFFSCRAVYTCNIFILGQQEAWVDHQSVGTDRQTSHGHQSFSCLSGISWGWTAGLTGINCFSAAASRNVFVVRFATRGKRWATVWFRIISICCI